MGLGGELPVASTLVSESVPAEKRGRIVVLLESFWAAGWLIAAVISYFIIPKFGWQVALLISATPAIYALYLRIGLPDSPRFAAVKEKRKDFCFSKYSKSMVKRISSPDNNAMDCLVLCGFFLLWNVSMASKCDGHERV